MQSAGTVRRGGSCRRVATNSSSSDMRVARPQSARPSGSALPVCRAAALQSSSSSSSSLQGLLDWAAANKVAVDKVAVASDVASDAQVLVAATDVAAGEQLLALPDSAWLMPASAQQQAGIGSLVAGLEPWLQLALLLLSERAKPAGSSSLAPYLAAAAPGSGSAHLDSPLFWGEDELALLRGSQLLESVRGYKQFFREQYDALNAQLFSANRAAFPLDAYSYERFAWAVATVRSRLHAPLDAEPLALVPLADALAHSRAGNAAWRLKSAGVFGRGKALSVEASRAVRKGEALVMDYGPGKLDSALLLDYGVLDWANPQGGYTLTLTLPESDRYFDDKADILERAGLGTSASFSIMRGQEPPREMMGFLRLMQLQGADCFLLEPIFEAEVWEFMCDPVSKANEAAVCAAMVEGAQEALAGYCSSIDEDLALLRGVVGAAGAAGGGAAGEQLVRGSRQEVAVQVRLGEKEALDGLMGFFEGRGADLKALEYYQERRLKRLGLMDEDGSSTYDSFFRGGIA